MSHRSNDSPIARWAIPHGLRLRRAIPPGTPWPPLTARQREVIIHVAEGMSSKQIATQLKISIKTVEKHRHDASEKLGIHDLVALVHYALRHGWVHLEE